MESQESETHDFLSMDELQKTLTTVGAEKVVIDSDPDHSYYIQYPNTLNYSEGVLNVYGYCRVSTEIQQEHGSSILTQIQLLFDYCNRSHYDEENKPLRYNLIRTYVDDGISAKNMHGRAGLMELQQYLPTLVSGRTYRKLGILASDLSRLTRSGKDWQNFHEWIKSYSLRLKFVDGSFNSDTASGELMTAMFSNFFEFERKNSSFKTKITLRSMSEKGILAGHCSYGWTTGIDEAGRKINVPVEEEQPGLNEVIRIHREQPDLTPAQIKNLMNESEFQCLRGPGRDLHGNHTEKGIKKNEGTEWTGKWTTAIIKTIIDHDDFDDRRKVVLETTKNEPINLLQKDQIVTNIIREYMDENDAYDWQVYNFSAIARYIDDRNLFSKKMDRRYVKKLMREARMISQEDKIDTEDSILETVEQIKRIIVEQKIFTYTKLAEVLNDQQIPLIGKRKSWNPSNVSSLVREYQIEM